MIREALELLQSTAVEAKGAQHLADSADGRTKHYVLDGKTLEIDTGPRARNHTVDSLDDLIRFAKTCSDAVVWHSASRVTLVCDDSDRRDFVTFPLPFSKQFDALQELENQSRFHQADFIRFLYRTLGVDKATVTAFRRLDFKVIQAAEGEVQHGKDRMGKSIHAEVKGTSELPEDILVHVPVYDALEERGPHSVSCSIDLDAQRSQIIIEPFPGELAIAIDRHQESIRTRLEEGLGDDARIYRGTP